MTIISILILYLVISCLLLLWHIHHAKDEQDYIKQETAKYYQCPQPYNIMDEATCIAQTHWQRESERTS